MWLLVSETNAIPNFLVMNKHRLVLIVSNREAGVAVYSSIVFHVKLGSMSDRHRDLPLRILMWAKSACRCMGVCRSGWKLDFAQPLTGSLASRADPDPVPIPYWTWQRDGGISKGRFNCVMSRTKSRGGIEAQ